MAAFDYEDIYGAYQQIRDHTDGNQDEDEFTGVAYLAYEAPAAPSFLSSDSSKEVGTIAELLGGYISSSRIGEVATSSVPLESSDSSEEDEEGTSANSTEEEMHDNSDWSDSEEDDQARLPVRQLEDIGPVQDSIWNAR